MSIAAGQSQLKSHRLASSGGYRDGAAIDAMFDSPIGLAFDSAGNLLIADADNRVIRKLSPEGQVSTLAGNGESGIRDGPALQAQFRVPVAVAVAPDGSIFVFDAGADMIRRITPSGMVESVAGVDYVACQTIPKEGEGEPNTPEPCPEPGTPRFRDGARATAILQEPASGVVADDGTLYFTDAGNYRVRYITADGLVGTLAGNGVPSLDDGQGVEAGFWAPSDITFGPDGHLYVSDGVVVRRVSLDGVVQTIAGDASDLYGRYEDGPVAAAAFERLGGLVVREGGVICVVDGPRVRRIAGGEVTTLSGQDRQGFQLGRGDLSLLSLPHDLVSASDGSLLLSEGNHDLVLRLSIIDGQVCR